MAGPVPRRRAKGLQGDRASASEAELERKISGLLDRVVQDRFPDACLVPGTKLRVDNGPAYRADRFIEHAGRLGFDVEHTQVKTPEENDMVESLHVGLDRDDLRQLVFDTIDEAAAEIDRMFHDDNDVKPTKRLGWRTPREYYEKAKTRANPDTPTSVQSVEGQDRAPSATLIWRATLVAVCGR